MSRIDTSAILAKEMAGIVQRHVADAVAPLVSRIKELESRPLAKDGAPGVSLKSSFKDSEGFLILTLTNGEAIKTEIRDGKSGVDGIAGLSGKDGRDGLDGVQGKDGQNGIDGKDGAPGRDGKDGEKGIDGLNGKDGVDGKSGLDGKDGTNGIDGKNGVDGRDGKDGLNGADGKSFTIEDAAPLIEQITQKAASLIPAPKDGRDGRDGKDGEKGLDGVNGKDGRDGIDGKDGAAGLNGKDADPHEIANVVLPEITKFISSNPTFKGDKGEPGRDGRDGSPGGPPGPQGERGEPGKGIDYLGVYEAGLSAKEGNAVTFGGSLWIAKRDTDAKPGDDDSWRLAVKRGRDGKDFTPTRRV